MIEPLPAYYQLGPKEQTLGKIEIQAFSFKEMHLKI